MGKDSDGDELRRENFQDTLRFKKANLEKKLTTGIIKELKIAC